MAKKWILTASVTVSAYTIVEAETLEAALEGAKERQVEIVFNGSGNSADEVWAIEDGDGEPQDIAGEEYESLDDEDEDE